ncbi:cytotoxic necrotizing factor [Sesbania bispinosa]|nr:cytotoxic necrotizing factor [Sesbania bispinosa]
MFVELLFLPPYLSTSPSQNRNKRKIDGGGEGRKVPPKSMKHEKMENKNGNGRRNRNERWRKCHHRTKRSLEETGDERCRRVTVIVKVE